MVMDVWFISDDDSAKEIESPIDSYLESFVPGGDEYKAKRSVAVDFSITGKVICERGAGVSIIKSEGEKALSDYIKKASLIGGVISDGWIKDCLVMPGVVDIEMNFQSIKCNVGEHPNLTSINLEYVVM